MSDKSIILYLCMYIRCYIKIHHHQNSFRFTYAYYIRCHIRISFFAVIMPVMQGASQGGGAAYVVTKLVIRDAQQLSCTQRYISFLQQ